MGCNVEFSEANSRATEPKRFFKLMSVSELMELPPPSWLIDGVMEENVLAVLYGASGEGKSFVALDWVLSIVTGMPWQGREVKRGPVVYVVAEGGRNVGKRIKAWTIEKHIGDVDDMLVVLDAVQFRNTAHVAELLRQIEGRNIKPRLIVIDTLARCFLGGDENSAQDMGEFVEACNRVQRATGATVLAVHHTGKPRGKKATAERGSYALRGAADVMIRVYQLNGAIHIKVDKQKDDELANEVCVRLKQVVVARDPTSGDDITSCVLVAADGPTVDFGPSLGLGPLATLKALIGMPESAADSGTWRKAVPPTNGKSIRPKTFQNHRQMLVDERFVEEIPGREHWYRATGSGSAMANGVPFERHRQSPIDAATATPPLGVAGGTGEARVEDILDVMDRLNGTERE